MEMTNEQKKALALARARASAAATEEPSVGVGEDVVRGGAAGLGRGVISIAGLPGDIREISTNVLGPFFKDKLGMDFGPEPQRPEGVPDIFKSSNELTEMAADSIRPAPSVSQLVTGEKPQTFLEYEPQTRAGKFARTAGEFAPGAVAGPGGWLTKGATTFGAAGLSEGLGQASEGTALEAPARVAGAVFGGLAGHRLVTRPTANDTIRKALPKNFSDYRALGDEAMVLDASPSTVGLAQGVTVTPGRHKDLIVGELNTREAGRSNRLLADVDTAIGRGRDADLVKQHIGETAQRRAGPMYEMAKRNAPTLPQDLRDMLNIQLTGEAEKLTKDARVRYLKEFDNLDDALVAGSPELVADRLHSMRKGYDKQIVHDPRVYDGLSSADKAEQSVLKDWRKTVDDILKNRFPGFREADEVVSKSKRMQEDVDYGRNALEGGKYASTPEKFAVDMKGRDKAMVGSGMKHDIRVSMGTQANDLPALRKKVGGENDFNREKLAAIFGQDAVDKMAGGVKREEVFSRNFADIDRNSQTYQRKEAADLVRGTDPPKITGQETFAGMGLKGIAALLNSVVKGTKTATTQPARDELVRILTTKGATGEAFMRSIQAAPGPMGGALTRAIANALLATTDARIGEGRVGR